MTLSDRNPYEVHAELVQRITNLEQRMGREDFSLMECRERVNGPHCPHPLNEHDRSAEMICCWCGNRWTEPRSQPFDQHGTWQPKPARERGS